MHSFSRLSKLLVPVCVLVLCAGMASARTKRSSHKNSGGKSAVTSTAKSSKHASARTVSKSRTSKKTSKASTRHVSRPRGQQAIESERVREIQEALIRTNYLDGEANGVWDDSTRRALTRFQSDNGWQSKVVPDSRALIKLGLGPNHENVINPETSLISRPPATDAANTLSPGGGAPHR